MEVAAAIKNIFSMAVGASKGLCSSSISNEVREKNYLNTASAIIKQSINEMEIFVEHLKGKKETVKGLAGLGDLYVSSGGGRNAKMGAYIGEGLTFSQAKKNKMEKITVEGAELAKEIAKKVNEDFDEKKLPLMLGMINAIVEDKKLELNWKKFIISIDAGTTSNRSILFDLKGKPIFSSQKEFTQYFPKSGWVEHNPEEIWNNTKKF